MFVSKSSRSIRHQSIENPTALPFRFCCAFNPFLGLDCYDGAGQSRKNQQPLADVHFNSPENPATRNSIILLTSGPNLSRLARMERSTIGTDLAAMLLPHAASLHAGHKRCARRLRFARTDETRLRPALRLDIYSYMTIFLLTSLD